MDHLILLSVVSANMEETHKRWRLEATAWPEEARPTLAGREEAVPFATIPLASLHWDKPDYRLLPDDPRHLGPAVSNASSFGGFMQAIDLGAGRSTWQSKWENTIATPSSFCIDGDVMWVADLEGSNIFQVGMREQPGILLRRVSHRALNDVHYVTRTRRGLLIASTGTDMIIELDEDGHSLYEWWAGDHGFTRTTGGLQRLPQRDAEHRTQYYHTRYHTTHVNAARYRDGDERYILASLWAQGTIVEIDTHAPTEGQTPRIVLDGLHHPHSIRPLPGGRWMVANTQGAELVVLDSNLAVERRVPSIPDWIQDAVSLGDGLWCVVDVNNRRLVIHDDEGNRQHEELFDPNWRVYAIDTVPDHLRDALSGSIREGATIGV